MEVPTTTTLRDIYPEDALPGETERWRTLLSTFKDHYGKEAEFVARSPGRVNIIGEVHMQVASKSWVIIDPLCSTLITPSMKYFRWRSLPTSSWQ